MRGAGVRGRGLDAYVPPSHPLRQLARYKRSGYDCFVVDAQWPKLLPADDSWRDRPLTQRAAAVESACRAAIQILEGTPDREDRLRHIDPVPASTRALLRRLAARR